MPLVFSEEPSTTQLGNVTGKLQYKFITEGIDKLVKTGTIQEVLYKPECVLPIKCMAKMSNKYRLVIDCQHVNQFIVTPKFGQESINVVAQLIEENDDLITADLKDGFLHVEIELKYR